MHACGRCSRRGGAGRGGKDRVTVTVSVSVTLEQVSAPAEEPQMQVIPSSCARTARSSLRPVQRKRWPDTDPQANMAPTAAPQSTVDSEKERSYSG